ncbi:hypothetical protein [Acidithiobacillus ferrooxidans]|uniref:hypothetical protein n=1 Tax=Acidithiobacillus ferrooxidans TaxID=920 RepID=UPI0013D67676|nr:hypothetical protein [Acidithiobacillus ferrooxidans]
MAQSNIGITLAQFNRPAPQASHDLYSVKMLLLPVAQEVPVEVFVMLHLVGANAPGEIAQHGLLADGVERLVEKVVVPISTMQRTTISWSRVGSNASVVQSLAYSAKKST